MVEGLANDREHLGEEQMPSAEAEIIALHEQSVDDAPCQLERDLL